MTGQSMYEHARQLANDLAVSVWIMLNEPDGEPAGSATWQIENGTGRILHRTVTLTHPPDTVPAYMVALHELGHIATVDSFGALRLDREAQAWDWAVEQALGMPPEAWARILSSLESYAEDRRYKRTPGFEDLLARARASAPVSVQSDS